MKRLLMCACVVLPLAAQAAPPQAADDIVLQSTPHKMFPQDWDAYAGKYVLSNGETMILRRRGLRMYAQLANRPPVQLVAAAENVFVAADGRLRMKLADEGLGHISGQVEIVAPRGR